MIIPRPIDLGVQPLASRKVMDNVVPSRTNPAPVETYQTIFLPGIYRFTTILNALHRVLLHHVRHDEAVLRVL